MPELAFLTLFLGLVSGPQPVAVSVVGEVAAIELRLDGRTVATLRQPPWKADVDFGPALLPHTLEARALDAAGQPVGAVAQWVNLPRPTAEVELQLERDAGGTPHAARLLWQNLTGDAPLSTAVTLDGARLAVEGGRVALPPTDVTVPHLLSAELRFANGIVARRDAAFGGGLGDALRTELTAVAVRLPGRPKPDGAPPAGAVLLDGGPAPIAATEVGPARLFVVRDPAAIAPLQRLFGRAGVSYTGQHRLGPSFPGGGGGGDVALAPQESLRFLWPQTAARVQHGTALKLFDGSRDFTAADGELFWLLTRVLEPASYGATPPQLADAVAVAGLQALGGNARRAVLLILAGEPRDPSQYDAASIAAYLRAVHVPLFVWRLVRPERGTSSPWGTGEVLTSPTAVLSAAERLQRELAAQRIVWVDGAHAPAAITLSGAARKTGVRFAGEALE